MINDSIDNNNNNNDNRVHKHRLAVALALFAIGGLFVSGLSTITTTPFAHAQEVESEQQITETQQSATQYLTTDLAQQGDLKFNVRWSSPSTLESETMTALFADCAPGEFAVSSMYMYENEDIETVQSFPIAIPENVMTWLTVAYNAGEDDTIVATGVVCVGEEDLKELGLDASTKQTIQNTVNRLIVEGGGTTVNVDYITKIYQSIVQKAIQIINVTGSNNTVNAVINQSASQIVESGGANVNQTIDQNAQQIVGANVTAVLEEEEQEAPGPQTNTTATRQQETIVTEEVEEQQQEGPALPPLLPPLETPTVQDEVEEEEETEPETPPPAADPTDTEPEAEPEEEEQPNVEVTDGELTDDSDNTAEGG